MKKKLTILEHNWGGRLANQLWNMANVYAYCLKNGYELENRSFFRYDRYFNLPNRNVVSKFFGFLDRFSNDRRRESKYYRKYTSLIKKIFPNKVLSDGGKVFNLDNFPTTLDCDAQPFFSSTAQRVEPLKEKNGWARKDEQCFKYLTGWLFRSPESVIKYHKEITKYLKPKKEILERVNNFIKELREETPLLVGIHIRQTDYKFVGDGSLFFEQKEVRKIIDDYLDYFNLNKTEVKFLICSDDKIDTKIFDGLNFSLGLGGEIEDMFSLANTDLIIGSNSSYGGFSAYYGNIPIICFDRKDINWESIRDKKEFNYKNTHLTIFKKTFKI